MELESNQIAAISIGLGLFSVILGLFVYYSFIVKRRAFTDNTVFFIKKWSFIFCIMVSNIAGAVLVYYTTNLQVLLYIIVVLKSKDILMSIMFVFNMIYKAIYPMKMPDLSSTDDINHIAAFVPVYKESLDQVAKSVDSIMNNKLGSNSLLVTVVSDGINNYSDLLTNKVKYTNGVYKSWNNKNVNLNIVYGYRNDKPMMIIHKNINVGKKDSIVLFNDIFNENRKNIPIGSLLLQREVLANINTLYKYQSFDYLYCTDSDTTVSDMSLVYLLDSLKQRNAMACCGIVNADNQHNTFWNWLQNYQYLYGQYMRRTNEDVFNQVLCLPGCNSMFKVDPNTSEAMELFSLKPKENELLTSCVQNIGTDRRHTGCIAYTTKNVKIVLDTRSHAYTVPPASLGAFFHQRKRWCQNMYLNNMMNIFGPNINIVLRFFNFIDFLRLSLVYFRLFNTLYFVYLLINSYNNVEFLDLIPYIVILTYPVVCFFVYAIFNKHLRSQYFKLLLMLLVNKIFTLFSTIVIFTCMLLNIGFYTWNTMESM